jgi:hypothetical protein
MGCDVYANGDEIACKAGSGKVIAGFPDVCLTPPPPPAGPIPVPYPNTAFSTDMQEGSKTVMIEGKEVMLKDQSFYKTSPLGDEAATNSQGAGVITHVITGKTYFIAWSMDVKFEGQNVDRHMDMTTSNHASPMANRVVPVVNGSKMCRVEYENQTCPEHIRKGLAERKKNEEAKHRQCASASPPTSPTGNAAARRSALECYRLKCRLSAERRLLALRLEKQAKCFSDPSLDTVPGNPKRTQELQEMRTGHDTAIAQTRVAIGNTRREIAARCR